MMSSEWLRGLFQWTDEEEEASGYASSVTVKSVQTGRVLANMTDNNNNEPPKFDHSKEGSSIYAEVIKDIQT